MNRLNDKVAIITGAGSGTGMGAVTARLFAQQGASVVITASQQREQAIKDLSDELNQQGLKATYAILDVTNEVQWQEVAAHTISTFGKINILVNNAGTPGPRGGWTDTDIQDVLAVMDVNLNSQFLGIKTVIPFMQQVGGGSIVNIGSAAAVIAFPDVNPGYAASKGASRMLSKSAAVDLAKMNIRVNTVLPGLIATPMATHFTEDEEAMQHLRTAIPVGRAGTSEEIAFAVLFLASDEASYVTATELLVDGGYTAI